MIKSNCKRLQLYFGKTCCIKLLQNALHHSEATGGKSNETKNKVIFMDIQTHEQNHIGQRALQKVGRHGHDV